MIAAVAMAGRHGDATRQTVNGERAKTSFLMGDGREPGSTTMEG